MKVIVSMILMATAVVALAQDAPVDIPKAELPKQAVCALCEGEGEELVKAGIRYKGKSFYFCNVKEVKKFRADPDAYVPPALPRTAGALLLTELDGGKKSLADFKGKVVLVDF